MNRRCEICPLTQSELIEKYCPRCAQEGSIGDPAHRCHTLGMILYRDEQFALAAEAFRTASQHSESFLLESVFNLALSEFRLGHYHEALSAIDRVVDYSPLPEAVHVKAIVAQRLGRWDEAETLLLRALADGYDRAASQLADLRWRRDLEFGESDAVAADPEKRLAFLAGLLERRGTKESEPRPTAQLLTQLGKAASQAGDVQLARAYYQRACETDLTADTATELAEFVLDYGGEDEAAAAERWLVQALTLERDHSRALHCLGRLQQSRGQLEQALHSMLSALRANPYDEYVIVETAELVAEMGNTSLCLSILARLDAMASADPYWVDRAHMLRRSIGAS
jgi:tetratricopeptide (TPR) repeat protein